MTVDTDLTLEGQSYSYGTGVSVATAGHVASFKIQAVDFWGNNRTLNNDAVAVTLTHKQDSSLVYNGAAVAHTRPNRPSDATV